jgi:hypothetical protein
MSEIITKDDGSPFATIESAKAKRTRMGAEGLDTNITGVDGGYVLEKKPYEKPKKRIPLGTRNVLAIDATEKDPAYSYRIVNDKGDRIRRFRDAGWEVVQRHEGMKVGDDQVGIGDSVGSLVTKSVGGNTTAYLMRIKREFYQEDQQAKADKIRQGESDLKLEKEKKGRYGDIKINDKPTH